MSTKWSHYAEVTNTLGDISHVVIGRRDHGDYYVHVYDRDAFGRLEIVHSHTSIPSFSGASNEYHAIKHEIETESLTDEWELFRQAGIEGFEEEN